MPIINKNNKETNKETEMNEIDKIFQIYNIDLINYRYIDSNNIINIPIGSKISCVKKNKYDKTICLLKSIKNTNNINNLILQVTSLNNIYSWFIYCKDVYVFMYFKKQTFREMMKELIDNDFQNLTLNFNMTTNKE